MAIIRPYNGEVSVTLNGEVVGTLNPLIYQAESLRREENVPIAPSDYPFNRNDMPAPVMPELPVFTPRHESAYLNWDTVTVEMPIHGTGPNRADTVYTMEFEKPVVNPDYMGSDSFESLKQIGEFVKGLDGLSYEEKGYIHEDLVDAYKERIENSIMQKMANALTSVECRKYNSYDEFKLRINHALEMIKAKALMDTDYNLIIDWNLSEFTGPRDDMFLRITVGNKGITVEYSI
jgi:hypothetical protein